MEAIDMVVFENKIYYILCQVIIFDTAALVKETCTTYLKKNSCKHIFLKRFQKNKMCG